MYAGDSGAKLTIDAVRAAIARLRAANAKPGAIVLHLRDFANLEAELDGVDRFS